MKTINLKYVKDAHKTYPQWDAITDEINRKFDDFHTDLIRRGYVLKAANVAEKNKNLFWILLAPDGNYQLEHYATIRN